MKKILTCEYCGKVFESPRKKRFCCIECQKAHRKRPFVMTCEHCGKVLPPKRKKRFCCRACQRAHYIETLPPERRRKRKGIRSFTCEYCGKTFEADRIRRYCCKECRLKAVALKEIEAKGLSMRRCAPRGICLNCGKLTGTRWRTFCCRQCAFEYKTYQAEYNKIVSEWEESRLRLLRCLTKIRNELLRNLLENLRAIRKQKKHTAVCEICGKVFEWTMGTPPRFCSVKCRKSTETAKAAKRRHKAKRRAMMRQLPTESIDPFDVFERDNWTCQMCGVATPKEKRGTIEPDAPELDHIKPLSKGGTHTWNNVQCLCRSCNQKKGDEWAG